MDHQGVEYRQHGIKGYGEKLFSVAIILTIFVYFAIGVRFFSRKLTKYRVGLDDWVIMAAGFFNTVMTAVTITDVFYGYGTPSGSLSPSDKAVALQMFWLTQIVYKIVMCCSKLSFCIFYLRIFPHTNMAFRYANIVVIALILGYSCASIVTTIVQCLPVARVWDKSIEGTCINLTAFWYANAVYSIFTDVLIIILPCTVCYKLQTSRKDKIGLFVIFSVGIFVIGTSIARFTTLDIASKSIDQTHGTLESTTWTTVEANTAIIVACLPSFKSPMKWLWKRYVNRQGHGHYLAAQVSHTALSIPSRVDSYGPRDIAIRTDVNIEFQEKSRESSINMTNRQPVAVQAHELA